MSKMIKYVLFALYGHSVVLEQLIPPLQLPICHIYFGVFSKKWQVCALIYINCLILSNLQVILKQSVINVINGINPGNFVLTSSSQLQ